MQDIIIKEGVEAPKINKGAPPGPGLLAVRDLIVRFHETGKPIQVSRAAIEKITTLPTFKSGVSREARILDKRGHLVREPGSKDNYVFWMTEL